MRSEALDIVVESRGDKIWVLLSGPFHDEQVPNIREEITGLVNDGNRQIVLDLEQVRQIGDAAVSMFLHLLNMVRSKGGELRFIFRNETVSKAFAPYRNIFQIFPDEASEARGGLLGTIKYRHRLWSRRTGIRLSRPVALFLLLVLCGWFLSLAFIIQLQNQRIRDQQTQLQDLAAWKERSEIELRQLNDRLQPMIQLGILPDDPDSLEQ